MKKVKVTIPDTELFASARKIFQIVEGLCNTLKSWCGSQYLEGYPHKKEALCEAIDCQFWLTVFSRIRDFLSPAEADVGAVAKADQ